MGYQYGFEKLEVWHDARRLVVEVYKVSHLFPAEEKFGLSSQIQRAAVSVVSNIAEGTSRLSDKEKIRFIEISFGSLMEVYCQLFIALDLHYISSEQFDENKKFIDIISQKLSGLIKSYKKRLG